MAQTYVVSMSTTTTIFGGFYTVLGLQSFWISGLTFGLTINMDTLSSLVSLPSPTSSLSLSLSFVLFLLQYSRSGVSLLGAICSGRRPTSSTLSSPSSLLSLHHPHLGITLSNVMPLTTTSVFATFGKSHTLTHVYLPLGFWQSFTSLKMKSIVLIAICEWVLIKDCLQLPSLHLNVCFWPLYEAYIEIIPPSIFTLSPLMIYLLIHFLHLGFLIHFSRASIIFLSSLVPRVPFIR